MPMQLFQGAQNFKINGATFVDQNGANNTTNIGAQTTARFTGSGDNTSHPESRESTGSHGAPDTYPSVAPQTALGVRDSTPQTSQPLPSTARRITNGTTDGETPGRGSAHLLASFLRILRG